MRATLNKFNEGTCEMRTENDLLVVVRAPGNVALHLGEEVIVSNLQLNAMASFLFPRTGASFSAFVQEHNVHDLHLPAAHGTSRTPSPERLAGA
jgi:hypothetical protein